jgi:hypothetical protein
MMEVVSTSETSVNFYETTRLNIPEDSNLHISRSESLKSHFTSAVDKDWHGLGLVQPSVMLVCYCNSTVVGPY